MAYTNVNVILLKETKNNKNKSYLLTFFKNKYSEMNKKRIFVSFSHNCYHVSETCRIKIKYYGAQRIKIGLNALSGEIISI